MGVDKSIYKSEAYRCRFAEMYQEKLESLGIAYSERLVETTAGRTHVLVTGDENLPSLVLLHGVNASAPIALEPIKGLASKYRIHAINTLGAPNPSAETRLAMHDDSYGKWLVEVLDGLGLERAPFIAASFGAFVLQRLIAYQPRRISAAIFVVPAGFGNGPFWPSFTRVLLPMFQFMRSKDERHLLRFMDAFYNVRDPYWIAFQKACLLGLHMDLRKPPLLTKPQAAALNTPVYLLVADDDIFFPGDKAIARCRNLFPGFREAVTLNNCKHIPDESMHSQIEEHIGEWLEAVLKEQPTSKSAVTASR